MLNHEIDLARVGGLIDVDLCPKLGTPEGSQSPGVCHMAQRPYASVNSELLGQLSEVLTMRTSSCQGKNMAEDLGW